MMLLGLSNILLSFQGYMNKILAEKLNVFIIIYPDDILIYTNDMKSSYIVISQTAEKVIAICQSEKILISLG